MNKKTRLEELRREVEYHNHLYYMRDAPEISDGEYDKLMQELIALEEDLGIDDITSPTKRVGGAPADGFTKVTRDTPMLSLGNLFDYDDLEKWLDKIQDRLRTAVFMVEPKIDGVALELYYLNGQLQMALTRGDGLIGEDVTANAVTIPSIPLNLHGTKGNSKSIVPGMLVVRGEAYISKDNFVAVNNSLLAAGQKPFKNPRNAAAGGLRTLDPKVTKARSLSFIYHSFVEAEHRDWAGWGTLSAAHIGIRSLGFVVTALNMAHTTKEILDAVRQIEANRHAYPFDIDGAVIKVVDFEQQAELGTRSKSPLWATAFKFPPEEVTATVTDISWHTGRTGVVTPVVHIEPTDVGGVTVSNLTGNNPRMLHTKKIVIGGKVTIRRAGDVIPEIVVGDYLGRRNIMSIPPNTCPSCGMPLIFEDPQVHCTNVMCPGRLKGALAHFVSRENMNIDGFGDRLVEQLFDAGVRHPADLYELTEDDLLELDGIKERSAEKLLTALEESKKPTLAKLIHALGIRTIGQSTANDLATAFGSIEDLASATVDELKKIDGLGDVGAEAIIEYFKDLWNVGNLFRLLQYVEPVQKYSMKSGPFAGKTVVVSGVFDRWERDELKDILRQCGAKVAGSVSKKTSYLFTGTNPGPKKLERADEYGTTVLNESDLISLLEEDV